MRDSRLYLEDILVRAGLVMGCLNRYSREEIVSVPNLYKATLRHIVTIGEAVKSLPDELKESHPEIPWGQIGRMRDVSDVGEDWIWEVVTAHIPVLAKVVRKVLVERDAGETPAPQ